MHSVKKRAAGRRFFFRHKNSYCPRRKGTSKKESATRTDSAAFAALSSSCVNPPR